MFQFKYNILAIVNNIVLSDKKKVSLFNVYFQIRLESQSVSLPYSWVTPPWRPQAKAITFPGGLEGHRSVAYLKQ